MKTEIYLSRKTQVTIRLVLCLSGLVASGIAVMILLAPDAFYASYGIELSSNATLANEMKAPAGGLFLAGLIMLFGVFRSSFVALSLATAAGVYLSYGLGRIASIAIDGLPQSGMVAAAGIELVVGTVCLLTLMYARKGGTV
ncbi:MAG: DUF4345 domain-containing protein [Woeseiaceae bacterium]|nr:DUF4345 domain-containing protein [Woeseiaceae bacterium]